MCHLVQQENAALSSICKKADPVVWHLGVEAEGRQPVGSTSTEQAPQDLSDLPLQQPSRPQGGDTGAASQGPTTSASGMSLQPPSLPAPNLQQQQQQQQQGMPAQLVPGSAQAQQQQQQQAAVAAAAIATSSPKEAGQLGAAGQKQAPKPPLPPGSKSVSQVLSASSRCTVHTLHHVQGYS